MVSADGRGLVSQAGAVLLWETMRVTGLGRGLSTGLDRWRAPRAVHDPGKIVADLAAAVALGGDCLADIAVLREQPELAGPVASDPVVSRLVSALAADLPRALKAIRSARAATRERAWALAGENAPGADGGLVTVDLDATIVIAHSEKEQAAPTWKKTFGFHPLAAFADHGAAGNGEPLAIMLRTGGAGSNTAADHIETTRLALAQLPRGQRRRVLVRTDSAGGTHSFLEWLTAPSRRLHYSVGVTVAEDTQAAILKVPADSWTPAYDGDGRVRDGAWVADITGMLDLSSWPAGMRVIVRKERPHPGAQLRFTRHRRAPVHRVRHRRQERAARGPRTAAPPPGPLRGPDPQRQGHRAAEPPPQGLRPEPAVVRDRLPGLRAAGLDPDARPDRDCPPLGTETAPAAPVLGRRAPGPRRPPAPAPPRRTMALGPPDHHRSHPPASHPVRLTIRNDPCDTEGATLGPVEPRPPGATAGQPVTALPENQPQPNTSSQHVRHAKD